MEAQERDNQNIKKKEQNIMATYNFDKKFKKKILDGKKTCTIRRFRNRRGNAVVGKPLIFTGGKERREKFAEFKCKSVQAITLLIDEGRVITSTKELNQIEIDELAKADGFGSARTFFKYYSHRMLDIGENVFMGLLVGW